VEGRSDVTVGSSKRVAGVAKRDGQESPDSESVDYSGALDYNHAQEPSVHGDSSSSTTTSSTLNGHQEALEQTVRRRLEFHNTGDTYLDTFKNALAFFKQHCTVCHVINGTSTGYHDIRDCPTVQTLPGAAGNKNYALDFSKNIQYRSNSQNPVKVCYKCHVPQYHDKLHATFTKGFSQCEHKDRILGVILCMFYNDKRKTALEHHFQVAFPTVFAYYTWLGQKTITGHESNGSAVFLWYWEEVLLRMESA
jgi:hypothetical protein